LSAYILGVVLVKPESKSAEVFVSCVRPHSHAFAATANVPFSGIVVSTCTLAVTSPGTLAASSNYTVLSSTQAGGSSGAVTIVSTGTAFKVSATAPSSFTVSPADGNTNTSFQAHYQATGATSIGTQLGTTQSTLNSGITNLTVDLAATKSSGVFSQGAYTSEVIVRCE
jgi:hypothetical protein